ncbi:MAG: TolC family protein [Flavobacteriales bacterium]|jgi:hypothetical protein|nr:TolC family protein [Flavobacteriales bacterium]
MKIIQIIGFYLLFTAPIFAQSDLQILLETIEKNNKTLAVMKNKNEAYILQKQSENKLTDLSISYYYLPYGVFTSPNYSEFQIGQEFDFPTAFLGKKKWLDSHRELAHNSFSFHKVAVFKKAIQLYRKWQILAKKKDLLATVFNQVKEINTITKSLYKQGEKSLLDLERAKMVVLQEQYKMDQIDLLLLDVQRRIQVLNGNKEISLKRNQEAETVYPTLNYKDLWNERRVKDPFFDRSESQIKLAQQDLKRTKQDVLPKITLGFNSQGYEGERYHGLFAGLRVPLWSASSKVKQAKVRLISIEKEQDFIVEERKSQLKQDFESYQKILKRYRDFKSLFANLKSLKMLQKAYQLGEMNFSEYYLQLSFYQNQLNQMIDMELELAEKHTELTFFTDNTN